MALRGHLTPRQDAFAMAYVESGNGAEAYRRLYSAKAMSQKAIEVEACLLAQHPKVTLRIEELHRAHADRHQITVESLTLQLEEARKLAMASKNPSAAVSATMGMAKLHGFLTDKLKHAGKDGAPLVPSITLTINRTGNEGRPDAAGELRPAL